MKTQTFLADIALYLFIGLIGIIGILMAASVQTEREQTVLTRKIYENLDIDNELPTKYSEEGIASYYGYESCSNSKCLMANGEPLDITKDTVAFWKAPLGAKVRILNPANHKSVIAEVTDTGNFHKYGRLIDLNTGVKEKLGCSDLCRVIVYW